MEQPNIILEPKLSFKQYDTIMNALQQYFDIVRDEEDNSETSTIIEAERELIRALKEANRKGE